MHEWLVHLCNPQLKSQQMQDLKEAMLPSTKGFKYFYTWWNDNDNDNILFDHNVQIEITIFNSLENQIINWSGNYY